VPGVPASGGQAATSCQTYQQPGEPAGSACGWQTQYPLGAAASQMTGSQGGMVTAFGVALPATVCVTVQSSCKPGVAGSVSTSGAARH
jgi:hypothetical protein